MHVRELHVPDRYAIAITSMARIGGKIYLGLTGGPRGLAVYDIDRDKIELKKELFPLVAGRGYCAKVHIRAVTFMLPAVMAAGFTLARQTDSRRHCILLI